MACALLTGIAAQARAQAQDRPPVTPQRDVDVLYRIAAPPAPGSPANAPVQALPQRMRWRVADQLLRVDPPSEGLWMVVDYRTRRMSLVREADRKVLDMAGAASPLPAQPGAGQGYVRAGADQVAGQPCTEWQAADTGGTPTLACITADGVMLRARQGARVLIEAVRVTYAPQDAAVFQLPGGFEHVQAPR